MGRISLAEIPSGSLCVVDTNVLLYAEQGVSLQAQALLRRCAMGELSITLPQTVWQELNHKLMLFEASSQGLVKGSNLARQLGRKPALARKLDLYREKIGALTNIGLQFEPCTRQDFEHAVFDLQPRYGMLTNDAVILAVARRLKAGALVTADEGFPQLSQVGDPLVYSPNDI
jgi:predicted nucleic acid-binding protein